MGARSGGGGGGGFGSRSTYSANVSLIGANGNYHYLSKDFKSQEKAEDWIDKVATKFTWKNKSGTADYGYVNKVHPNGYEESTGTGRDFGKIWEKQMAQEFRNSL